MKVLLITDDEHEETILLGALQMANFSVVTAPQLAHADGDARQYGLAQLIITTAVYADPVAIIRQFRLESDAPLILVVDAVTERLHAQMIEEGADLVFTRPLSVRLLVAYGRSLLRKTGERLQPVLSMRQKGTAAQNVVRLDPARRVVLVQGRPPQRLSQLEYRLLHTLMLNRGQVIPTETIVERVWGYNGEGDRSLVRGLINRLRAKIEPNPENPRYIRTAARIGYMFSIQEADNVESV